MFRSSVFWGMLAICWYTACQPSAPSSSEDATTETVEEPTTQPLDRFEKEIVDFEKQDQELGIDSSRILFVGSSSIRMWDGLAEDMAPLQVLNRGFGGSTLPEVSYYANRIIFPHRPQTIVLYCGENDISDGASPQQVYESFTALMARIRIRLPQTEVYFISMKPSIARWDQWPAYQEGNELIEAYIDQYPHLHYLDCSASMLQAGGQIDSSIFIADGLHMNEEGYRRWKALVKLGLTP
ncbi:MAG: SGNH/GDSL hydrolase family protein [Bacteroidota bacterium]